jgi:hypothetical protein
MPGTVEPSTRSWIDGYENSCEKERICFAGELMRVQWQSKPADGCVSRCRGKETPVATRHRGAQRRREMQ